MKSILRPLNYGLVAASIIAILISGCAMNPHMDGGIVGTGDRPDCEHDGKSGDAHRVVGDDCKDNNASR